MELILLNLANRELLEFCKENGIDPSGTIVQKYKRGANFGLFKQLTGERIAAVEFTKNSSPSFTLGADAQAQRKAKIERLRNNAPGYILGDLTPFATDSDVLEMCIINDRKAAIHNRALAQKKYRS